MCLCLRVCVCLLFLLLLSLLLCGCADVMSLVCLCVVRYLCGSVLLCIVCVFSGHSSGVDRVHDLLELEGRAARVSLHTQIWNTL